MVSGSRSLERLHSQGPLSCTSNSLGSSLPAVPLLPEPFTEYRGQHLCYGSQSVLSAFPLPCYSCLSSDEIDLALAQPHPMPSNREVSHIRSVPAPLHPRPRSSQPYLSRTRCAFFHFRNLMQATAIPTREFVRILIRAQTQSDAAAHQPIRTPRSGSDCKSVALEVCCILPRFNEGPDIHVRY